MSNARTDVRLLRALVFTVGASTPGAEIAAARLTPLTRRRGADKNPTKRRSGYPDSERRGVAGRASMRRMRHGLLAVALGMAVLLSTSSAEGAFRVNRSMAGVELGMSRSEVQDRLGRPARRERGPDFVNWRYRLPAIQVTFKPQAVTLFTRSAFVRGPRDIGVGTHERRLKRVLGGQVQCETAEGQRLCFVGSFETGRRSTVFVMRRRQVTSVTISISTP
jgi:hypothetical protein